VVVVCDVGSGSGTYLGSDDEVPVELLVGEQLLDGGDDEEAAGDHEGALGREKVVLDVNDEERCALGGVGCHGGQRCGGRGESGSVHDGRDGLGEKRVYIECAMGDVMGDDG
jgi:hypothetical protein